MRIFGIFVISQPISMEFIRDAPDRQENICKNYWYYRTGSNAIMRLPVFANVQMTPLFPLFQLFEDQWSQRCIVALFKLLEQIFRQHFRFRKYARKLKKCRDVKIFAANGPIEIKSGGMERRFKSSIIVCYKLVLTTSGSGSIL